MIGIEAKIPSLARFVSLAIVLPLLLASACPMLADTLTLSTEANYWVDGVLQTSDPSTSSGASVSSLVTSGPASGSELADFSLPPFAHSLAQADGTIRATVDGYFWDGAPFHELESEATYRLDFTGTGGVLGYDFFIPTTTLFIRDDGGGPVAASFGIYITLFQGAASTSLFATSASLNLPAGASTPSLVSSGASLGAPTTVCNPVPGGACIPRTYGVEFGIYSDTLTLGTFGLGETGTLEILVTAFTSAFGLEQGGIASIGDPGDVSGPGFHGSIVGLNAVPEPGTLLLLGSGLAIVGARRRRPWEGGG